MRAKSKLKLLVIYMLCVLIIGLWDRSHLWCSHGLRFEVVSNVDQKDRVGC